MDYLTVLDQSVITTLDSGRIGTPVFVRWTASVAETKDDLKALLAAMTTCTTGWLGAKLDRLYATGTVAQGHLSLSLEYATGSTALLALTLAYNSPHINLAIYGNQGAIYHNDFIAPTRDGGLVLQQVGDDSKQTLHQDTLILLKTIDQSLAIEQPIALAQPGGQL